MTRRCSICDHPERDEIDRLLLRRTPSRKIAADFEGVSRSSIQRHAESHIPTQLARAEEAAELISVGNLLGELNQMSDINKDLLIKAAETGNDAYVVGLLKERRHLIGVELSMLEATQKERGRQQDAALRLRELEARERATEGAIQAAARTAAREIVRELLTGPEQQAIELDEADTRSMP